MRVKKRRNDLFAAAIGVSIAFGGVCMTMAQEDAATSSAIRMPDGWGDQPLDVFLQQYRSLPDRPGARNEFLRVVAEDQRMPIADRAWVFLQNAQLIQEADWALVEELVASFANTAKWFSDGDERAALLSQRFSERLAAEGQAISGDYQRLNTHVAAMRIAGIADAETKINEAQLAWLQSHDLSEMPPIARMRAFEWPSVSESAISAEFVSARFSGFITVPAAGTYTFSAYRTDPLIETDPLRVLIDGVVVLDTSIASSDNSSESQTSIDLQSGAHPIVVEYRGYKKRGKRPYFVVGYPRSGRSSNGGADIGLHHSCGRGWLRRRLLQQRFDGRRAGVNRRYTGVAVLAGRWTTTAATHRVAQFAQGRRYNSASHRTMGKRVGGVRP